MYWLILCLFALTIPLQSPAAVIDLTEQDFQDARNFVALHKQNAGIVLNNTYLIGSNKLFTEHAIIRTKWHKLVLLYMAKYPDTKLTDIEKEVLTRDDNLQIDIILFGHSLGFAQDYKAHISQGDIRSKPQKIHADHFQSAQHKKNIYSGFPRYTATLRTYFDLTGIDTTQPFTLTVTTDECTKPFTIDLRNFK